MNETEVDSQPSGVRAERGLVPISAIGRLIFAALVAGSLAALALLAWMASPGPVRKPSLAASDLPKSYAPLGDFALTERTGRTVTRDDLLGKVTVVGFVFTCCHQTCPMVSGVMNRLRAELPAETRLISISVDPATDTPEVLTEYAAKLSQATEENWWFLTGDRDEIHALLRHGFRVGVMENPDAEARGEERITHTTRLALLDRSAHVRGYFDSADPAAIDALKLKVNALLREAPVIRVESLPALNATLNGLAAVLLVVGWALIKRRRVGAHKATMIAALAVSALFLASYLFYHFSIPGGSRKFPGRGGWRVLYFAVLVPHILLAIGMLPMIAVTFARAFRGRFDAHRRIARWTLPIWLYVSVTGVVVYVMLYRVSW